MYEDENHYIHSVQLIVDDFHYENDNVSKSIEYKLCWLIGFNAPCVVDGYDDIYYNKKIWELTQ